MDSCGSAIVKSTRIATPLCECSTGCVESGKIVEISTILDGQI